MARFEPGHLRNVTHGHWVKGQRSPTYKSWGAMIQRCTNTKNKRYPDYGGRGIQVCERWRNSFEDFLADMGERPEGLTLDRIENDKNYEPGNCRWATRSAQNFNRRPKLIEFNGESLTLGQWAERLGISKAAICKRLNDYGWTLERTLSTPRQS